MEVNFDPALGVVLREVRYFLGMRNPSIEIPPVGLKVRAACLRALLPDWPPEAIPPSALSVVHDLVIISNNLQLWSGYLIRRGCCCAV